MAPPGLSEGPPSAGDVAPPRVLIDGAEADRLPVSDRGLAYGDGLFETVLIRDGAPCQWARHLARLAAGCVRLGFAAPPPACLESEARARVAGVDAAVLKLIITRGSGGRGYRPPVPPVPRRILALFPLPVWPAPWATEGVPVRYCQTPASENRALAGLKHLNRLDNVLARAEWDDPRIGEGLMLGPDGRVVGGTMSNLFVWTGTALLTPATDRAGISGTVRGLTLDLARAAGIECRETDLHPPDLRAARGLFLTNALIGVWPVCRLDGQDYAPTSLPWDLLQSVTRAAHLPG